MKFTESTLSKADTHITDYTIGFSVVKKNYVWIITIEELQL